MEKKKIVFNIAVIIAAAMAAFALNVQYAACKVTDTTMGFFEMVKYFVMDDGKIVWLVLLILFCILFHKTYWNWQIKNSKMAVFVGFIFTVCIWLGYHYSVYRTVLHVFTSKKMLIINIVMFLGYWILFTAVVDRIYRFLEEKGDCLVKEISPGLKKFFDSSKGKKLVPALILLGWSPYLVVFFPGSTPYDSMYQINMFFGAERLSNHHPILDTFLLGGCVKLGRMISGDALGIFLYVVFQVILLLIVLQFFFKVIEEMGMNGIFRLSCLLFFSVFPLWGAYIQSNIKDVIYITGLLAWILMVFLILKREDCSTKMWVSLLVLSILVCLLRNNGIYAVLPTLVGLVFVVSKQFRIKAGLVLAGVLSVYLLEHKALIPALGIDTDSTQESFSIPFQQTARYVREYGEEVTDREKEVINGVLSYDKIVKDYDPDLSSNVKWSFHGGKEETKEYLKVWRQMLFKHPEVYIDSFFDSSYGYFYPEVALKSRGMFYFDIRSENKYVLDYNYSFPKQIRQILKDYTTLSVEMTGIGVLYNSAVYTWMTVLIAGFLLRIKQKKYVILTIPSLINFLVCLASPVNGSIRYSLPSIIVMPFLIALTFYLAGKRTEDMRLEYNLKNISDEKGGKMK
ncbi:MAG: hypothetical protein HFH41_05740 [Lachnospiraceae bacterium]|nr:hypothetical protein [Lachnospiraceae bacterium]